MGTYVILSKLTSQGVKGLKGRPEAVPDVGGAVAALDGKVVEQYALLGEQDFCTIVSLPDNAAAQFLAGQTPEGVERAILPAVHLPLFVRLLGPTPGTEGPHPPQG